MSLLRYRYKYKEKLAGYGSVGSTWASCENMFLGYRVLGASCLSVMDEHDEPRTKYGNCK